MNAFAQPLPTGDHEGPPPVHPAALAPTDYLASGLSLWLRLSI